MASIKVTFPGGKFQSKVIDKLQASLPKNLPAGLQACARTFKGGVRGNLKQGTNSRQFKSHHTKLRSDSGELKKSIATDPTSGARGRGRHQYVIVGSGGIASRYGEANERGMDIPVTKKMRNFIGWKFGIWLRKTKKFIHIPARPWFVPALHKTAKRAYKVLAKFIFKAVKK